MFLEGFVGGIIFLKGKRWLPKPILKGLFFQVGTWF
jgi:hypothetical protein